MSAVTNTPAKGRVARRVAAAALLLAATAGVGGCYYDPYYPYGYTYPAAPAYGYGYYPAPAYGYGGAAVNLNFGGGYGRGGYYGHRWR